MTSPAAARLVGALSRRVRTLIVSGVLFLVLLILALTLPVPYVILSPGVTCNTIGTDQGCNGSGEPIIKISGIATQKREGNLNLTTVYVTGPDQELTVFDALSAWLQSDRVVVPRSSVYPPGESSSDVEKQNSADFAESQDSAIAAAGCELGYPEKYGVVTVTGDGPAGKVLQPGDLITSVDGTSADTGDELLAILAKTNPGTKVQVAIVRAGKPSTVSITVGKPIGNRTGGSFGIGAGPVCQLPFTVDLGLGNQIGGPSAGLMFALGIIDKVGKDDLTDGAFIAGTGTIDSAGNVGAIGGIALKMIAARNAGATVFLAPADNCKDVSGNVPSGLQVIKVATLHEAVADLEKIEDKQSVPGC